MASWHQSKNHGALLALWTPDPTQWKCIADKYNRPASCMRFQTEAEARAYAANTGDIVLPPQKPQTIPQTL